MLRSSRTGCRATAVGRGGPAWRTAQNLHRRARAKRQYQANRSVTTAQHNKQAIANAELNRTVQTQKRAGSEPRLYSPGIELALFCYLRPSRLRLPPGARGQ